MRISTTTSPLMPCAFTRRPTVNSKGAPCACAPLLVGVHHVDADTAAADTGDKRAQRGRGTSAATDHLAQVVGMDAYFDSPPTPTGHKLHPDIVGVVDNPADQMLNSVDDDRTHVRQLSAVGSDDSPPSTGVSAC